MIRGMYVNTACPKHIKLCDSHINIEALLMFTTNRLALLRQYVIRRVERCSVDDFRVFAENLVGLGFLSSVSYIKPILTHEKFIAVGKKWPKCHF